MPKDRLWLSFDAQRVKAVRSHPRSQGRLPVSLTLKGHKAHEKASVMRGVADAFAQAANELYDLADKEEWSKRATKVGDQEVNDDVS